MASYDKLGPMTILAAADIADTDHAINQVQPTSFNGSTNSSKVLGQMYLRDNGSNSYDIAIPLEAGPTGKWLIIGTGSSAEDGNSVVTPS